MTARMQRYAGAAWLAAISVVIVSAFDFGSPRALADDAPSWSKTEGTKPLQIVMELDPDDGTSPDEDSYIGFGELIRIRLDWRMLPNHDLLASVVQFRSAPKPAPRVRVWADAERTLEVFAETMEGGGSQPTYFDLDDLPTSLWLDPDDAGTLKFEMRTVDR